MNKYLDELTRIMGKYRYIAGIFLILPFSLLIGCNSTDDEKASFQSNNTEQKSLEKSQIITDVFEREINPVSREMLAGINLRDYFPSVGMNLKYAMGDSNKLIKKENVFATNVAGERAVLSSVFEENNTISQSASLYRVGENRITLVAVEDKTLGSASTPNEIILSKEPMWHPDNSSTVWITGINLTIKTRAGIFKNVIEVTKQLETDNSKYLVKEYYSPGIGRILNKGMGQNSVDLKVISELIEYNSLNNNISSSLESPSTTSSTNINTTDEYGVTKLAREAGEGNVEAVKRLLSEGADPNLCKEYGEPPLLWAVRSNQDEVVRILLEAGANPNFKSREGITALKIANEQGANVILNYLDKYGATE